MFFCKLSGTIYIIEHIKIFLCGSLALMEETDSNGPSWMKTLVKNEKL